jgi:cytochrome c biogenesis protein CcdA
MKRLFSEQNLVRFLGCVALIVSAVFFMGFFYYFIINLMKYLSSVFESEIDYKLLFSGIFGMIISFIGIRCSTGMLGASFALVRYKESEMPVLPKRFNP